MGGNRTKRKTDNKKEKGKGAIMKKTPYYQW